MKKLHKGFTLVEVIVTLMLISAISLILGIVFNTVFKSQGMIDREATIQAEMRTSMQTVDNAVQKATAIFVLDDSKYGKGVKKTEGWSYIGLSDDGKKILDYRWNKTKKSWDIKELGVKSQYDMKLDLNFESQGQYQDNRVVKYNLKGQYKDSNNKLALDTAVMALNTKQVFSRVGKQKKGVAIAYRNDPIEGLLDISVSFVFDTSGSMAWDMNHKNPYDTNEKSRIKILKEKANALVDNLSLIGNVSVNLTEFNDLGKYVKEEFVDLSTDKESLKTAINGLNEGGGTNPGDGLRYSLVSLKKNKAQLKYVVLLTDGLPNLYTVGSYSSIDGSGKYNKKYGDPKPDLTDKVGVGANTNILWNGKDFSQDALNYTGQVMNKFGKGLRRVSVIGFSAVKDEISKGQEMTNLIGSSGVEAKYVEATSEQKLQEVFDGIKKQIEEDKWFLTGP